MRTTLHEQRNPTRKIDRLLELGEPLLAAFPKRYPEYPDSSALTLPHNISYNMRWYAHQVAFRAGHSELHRYNIRALTAKTLTDLVKDLEDGFLGWRALGVLRYC